MLFEEEFAGGYAESGSIVGSSGGHLELVEGLAGGALLGRLFHRL